MRLAQFPHNGSKGDAAVVLSRRYNRRPKICMITTIDTSLGDLFAGLYPLLLSKGYEVVGICADTSGGVWTAKVRRQGVRVINVPMTRTFSIWQDVKCLWRLYRIFRQESFDIVHYSTPKASFLSAIAGHLAGISFLVYTLRGLGYAAFNGATRVMGKWCEIVSCRAADRVLAISQSLAEEAVREGLLCAGHIEVLGAGSSKGVNIEQFCPNNETKERGRQIRRALNISDEATVVGLAGRLTPEKGIEELLAAFENLRRKHEELQLLIVGPEDQRHPLRQETVERIRKNAAVHLLGPTTDMPGYMSAMDVFALPSYREGFGNVIIEASAMELPVIASDILGCRNAVVDGVTGYLVTPRDVDCLQQAIEKLISDPAERTRLGKNGRQWVVKNFDRRLVWSRLIKLYDGLLDAGGKQR
jgi:glycosyltransferase involved in cell wall biosynthesis